VHHAVSRNMTMLLKCGMYIVEYIALIINGIGESIEKQRITASRCQERSRTLALLAHTALAISIDLMTTTCKQQLRDGYRWQEVAGSVARQGKFE